MQASKFYALLIFGLGVMTVGCITLINIYQPDKVDVELWTRVAVLVGVFVGPLVAILNANAGHKQVLEGQEKNKEDVVRTVQNKAEEVVDKTADRAAVVAAQLVEENKKK